MARPQPTPDERPLTDMAVAEILEHPQYGPIKIGSTVQGTLVWAAWGDHIETVRIHAHEKIHSGHPLTAPLQFESSASAAFMVQIRGMEYSAGKRFPLLPHRYGHQINIEAMDRHYVYRAVESGYVLERLRYGVVLGANLRKQGGGTLTQWADEIDASLALVVDRAIGPEGLTFLGSI